MAGGKGGDRGWDVWMASPTQCTWVWADTVKDREAQHAAVHGAAESQMWLSDWAPPPYNAKIRWFS